MKSGSSLIIVGAGIQTSKHITSESKSWMRSSDVLLHGVADPISLYMLGKMNSNLFDLNSFYKFGRSLKTTYNLMVEKILKELDKVEIVCVAMYGHPGLYVESTHSAMKIARERGHHVKLLPGISSIACMFSDLEIDPSRNGYTVVEATDLIVHDRQLDTTFNNIIMQVGFIGELEYKPKSNRIDHIDIFKEKLYQFYPPDHSIIIYEASQIPITEPIINRVKIKNLNQELIPTSSSILIPPLEEKRINSYYFNKLNVKNIYD